MRTEIYIPYKINSFYFRQTIFPAFERTYFSFANDANQGERLGHESNIYFTQNPQLAIKHFLYSQDNHIVNSLIVTKAMSRYFKNPIRRLSGPSLAVVVPSAAVMVDDKCGKSEWMISKLAPGISSKELRESIRPYLFSNEEPDFVEIRGQKIPYKIVRAAMSERVEEKLQGRLRRAYVFSQIPARIAILFNPHVKDKRFYPVFDANVDIAGVKFTKTWRGKYRRKYYIVDPVITALITDKR